MNNPQDNSSIERTVPEDYCLPNLSSTKDDEIKRLNQVVKDFGEQIREYRTKLESFGEVEAWIVDCPIGYEFDKLIFPHYSDAEDQANLFNEEYPEGEKPHIAIPLYRIGNHEEINKLLVED